MSPAAITSTTRAARSILSYCRCCCWHRPVRLSPTCLSISRWLCTARPNTSRDTDASIDPQQKHRPPPFFAYEPDRSLLEPANAATVRQNALRRGYTLEEVDAALTSPGDMICRLPNWTHPESPIGGASANRLVRLIGAMPPPPPEPTPGSPKFDARAILEQMRLLASRNLSQITGARTHFTRGQLARLEGALVTLALDTAREHGFTEIGVPEVVPPELVNACGFSTDGTRSQVFLASDCEPGGGRMALIGTAEIALAGFSAGGRFRPEQLPLRLCAVSRCYRREISQVEDALYRVPQFTKVELFCVTTPADSEAEHFRILGVQESILSKLGLHCRLLDMASEELGAPAYRKFDWEAWMPSEGRFGELCSASNCTDYQSRRLDIRCADSASFAHTLNGTACAVTRTLKVLVETHLRPGTRSVPLPEALAPHMAPWPNQLEILRQPSMRAMYFAKLQRQPML